MKCKLNDILQAILLTFFLNFNQNSDAYIQQRQHTNLEPENAIKVKIQNEFEILPNGKRVKILCTAGSHLGIPVITWTLSKKNVYSQFKHVTIHSKSKENLITSTIEFIPYKSHNEEILECSASIFGNLETASIKLKVKEYLKSKLKSKWYSNVQSEEELQKIKCSSRFGEFPYDQDCGKYVSCSNWIPYLMPCPSGTLYSRVSKRCDYASKVDCNREEVDPKESKTFAPSLHAASVLRDNIDKDEPTQTSRSGIKNIINRNGNKALGKVEVGIQKAYDTIAQTTSREIRNEVRLGIRIAENKYYRDMMQNRTGDTKGTWKDTKTQQIDKKNIKQNLNSICPQPNGLFPYKKDCSKYINCYKYRPYIQTCSFGTLFHPYLRNCDFEDKVRPYCPPKHLEQDSDAKPKPPRPKLLSPPSGQKIRLRGGSHPWIGYVELYIENTWFKIISTQNFDKNLGNSICKNLGFERGAESISKGAKYSDIRGIEIKQREMICKEGEGNIFNCTFHNSGSNILHNNILGVHCLTDYRSQCQEGWYGYNDQCYKVISKEKLSHEDAREACKKLGKGSRLVSIDSQKENDFVSELINWESEDKKVVNYHTAGVKLVFFEDKYWLWQDYMKQPTLSLSFYNWWPGWLKEDGRNSSLVAKSSLNINEELSHPTLCIGLRNVYKIEFRNKIISADAEYYFWKLIDCNENGPYVCQQPKSDIGCFSGRGTTYRGSASVTKSGVSCLEWTNPKINTKIYSFNNSFEDYGFENNYCRNPDKDEAPYCYTQQALVEYCDIPRCKSSSLNLIDEESEFNELDEENCPPEKFQCSPGDCIHKEWLCNGNIDCKNGVDEQGCPDFTPLFRKLGGRELLANSVETWVYTSKISCASRCAQSKSFICKSFNYQEATQTCILFAQNAGEFGGLRPSANWEYHEFIPLALNCTNKCIDHRCLLKQQICDAKRDCVAGEDELSCPNAPNVEVRLVDGSTENEGRVEIKFGKKWSPICDDMFDRSEADVICHQLGYDLGARFFFTNSRFGSGTGEYLMDDLNCRGDEESIAHCDFAGWGQHDCGAHEAAGVHCYIKGGECSSGEVSCDNGRCVHHMYLCDQINDCFDGSDETELCRAPIQVRLVSNITEEKEASARFMANLSEIFYNSTSRSSNDEVFAGRVEVFYKGIWGTICDDDFDIKAANVICRMLGYTGASSVQKNGWWGEGEGLVWLDDVKCGGNEKCISECNSSPWGETNCKHDEDVGVVCTNVEGNASEIISTNIPNEYNIKGNLFSECGVREVEDQPSDLLETPRIVKGKRSIRGAHPWMVGIRHKKQISSSHWCGAAIINENYIMTAAHCVNEHSKGSYILRIGDHDNTEKELKEEEFLAEAIFVHKDFDSGPYLNNDIALVKVKSKNGTGIRFGKYVQPICLPDSDYIYPTNINCTVAGWGRVGDSMAYSKVLKSVNVPLLDETICKKEHVYGTRRLTDGMFCAGHLQGGIDTCQGDSGGPLVCNINGRYTAIGITSWGIGCARANKPGVYTKVTYYLDWILEQVSRH